MEQQTAGPRCIAYTEEGSICGGPAAFLDVQRGGMVCEAHDPRQQTQAEPPRERSREEIEYLKGQWESDPSWDLEETEGFEAHREELAAFAATKKAEWAAQRVRELEELAASLGLPGNVHLAAAIERINLRIEALAQKVEAYAEGIDARIDRVADRADRNLDYLREKVRRAS